MRYSVKETGLLQCHITLLHENKVERKLLNVTDKSDREAKEYTFEVHYQRAITSKFEAKAHLISMDEDDYPTKVYAGYIIEGGTLGNQ